MQLLEPITIGTKTVKNRVAVTPYSFWFSAYNENEDGRRYEAHLQRQAEGGAGFIGVQAMWVPSVTDEKPFPYDYLLERLSRIAEVAHRAGAIAVIQSVHPGVSMSSVGVDPALPWGGEPLWGFSPVASDTSLEMAHEMTDAEVESLVEGWGRLAELATASGLDGMELHGGHGYLLHQSISPWMNHRQDKWGEPLAFWTAVLERVRQGLGPDALLGARVPTDDFRTPDTGGLGPDRLRELAVEIAQTGLVDYLNPSEGSSGMHYPRSVGTFRRPHGDFLENTSKLRAALDGLIPVLGVGRITTVDEAEAALTRGDCDFVGMTRAHIADPSLVLKLEAGEASRIRPCVGSNNCINRIVTGVYAMCFHNPEAGREDDLGALRPATQAKRVLVVGGGPAGLKAAEIAARRGHDVTVVERGAHLGGRLAYITDVTRAEELLGSVRWIEAELGHLGVKVVTDTEVDADFLQSEQPDVIVLATGSRPADLPFSTDDSVDVMSTEAAMQQLSAGALPSSVLLYDFTGADEAAVVTEQLATSGAAVTVVTPLPNVGVFLGHTHAADHLPRLLGLGCVVEERTGIVRVAEGRVTTASQLTGEEVHREFGAVVVAQPRAADHSLQAAAQDVTAHVHVIGDALAPRDAFAAFLNGEAVGRLI